MYLKHLSLTNFRNFIRLEQDFSPGSTILIGANGQGKTSLLEAIYYLTSASTYHASHDRQLINFLALDENPPLARIVAEVEASKRLRRIEIRIILGFNSKNGQPRIRKEIFINGLSRRVRELAGVCNAVLFLPRDMEIIEGSPGNRRRYLDNSLSQADPIYAAALSDYQKVLSQRNALLKQIQDRKIGDEQLSFWDDQLCQHAAVLIKMRSLALTEMDELAKPIYQKLTRAKETLKISYNPSYDPVSGPVGQLDLPLKTHIDRNNIPLDEIKNGLKDKLQSLRHDEMMRGITLAGPHRDDFTFLSDGIDLGTYGSRGQNRTAILATKLGEISWLRERTQEWPILLLDEVLAELDTDRRSDLLESIEAVEQAILTGADLEMFSQSFREEATTWTISGGTISEFPINRHDHLG